MDKIRQGIQEGDEAADTKMGDGEDGNGTDEAAAMKDPGEAKNEAFFNIV